MVIENKDKAADEQKAPPVPEKEGKTDKPWFARKKLLLIAAAALLVVGGGGLGVLLLSKDRSNFSDAAIELPAADASDAEKQSAAIKAGKDLSGGNCTGEGPVTLSVSPMKADDFAFIIPYGLMIDGHVTPIDHQYFSPTVFNSPPDTYEVRAMADGRITEISHRAESVGNKGQSSNDYRFVFSHTCTFLTYYDLVTSLAPEIQTEFDKNKKGEGFYSFARLDIPVKAGQLVGYIGGQTLDFAVWDTTKPLRSFVTPELYSGERWKLYTADPLDYYGPELKELAVAKYLRTDANKSGKIDYDVDGKLIGNWFQEGTNGYEGDRQQADGRYWRGHLAIAPDHLDPSYYIASFGTYAKSGDGEQFVITAASPDPKEVGEETGLVKYDLAQWAYEVDGQPWSRMTVAKNPKISINGPGAQGCVLYQLLESRKLRAEPFPDKKCSEVGGFSPQAKTFVR